MLGSYAAQLYGLPVPGLRATVYAHVWFVACGYNCIPTSIPLLQQSEKDCEREGTRTPNLARNTRRSIQLSYPFRRLFNVAQRNDTPTVYLSTKFIRPFVVIIIIVVIPALIPVIILKGLYFRLIGDCPQRLIFSFYFCNLPFQ